MPEDDPPIFVWTPAEAEEMPGYVWRLQKALPGLKESAQVWGGHASDTLLREHDLKQSGADECLYWGKDIVMLRHMDDFVVVGPRGRVKSVLDALAHTLLVSGIEMLTEAGQKMHILGRVLEET